MKRGLVIGLCFLLAACEKDINFDLSESQPSVVVEAKIENGQAPVVILSRSLSFYSNISPAILSASFIHDAEVTISNGTLTHRLKEYAYPFAPGIEAYYYSIDSTSLNTAFWGELDHTYTLRIVDGQKEYTSTTRIPALQIVPDSVWFKQAPANPDTLKRILTIKATDPPGLGNYVRYFTKVNQEPFYTAENSVFNDEVVDGSTYQVILPKGYNRLSPPEPDENYFFKGDSVTLKFCNIDRASYTFWNTWEFAYQSIGNPFSQPNRVLGNISNGALGAFCGYAVWYGTYVLQ